MGFFTRDKTKHSLDASTIIAKNCTCFGDIIGDDDIQIAGEVQGNIHTNGVVRVNQDAKVLGDIKAQQIIVHGEVLGSVICESLETHIGSRLIGGCQANKILTRGDMQGDISCEGLFVEADAVVDAKVHAKDVVVRGVVMGRIACEKLFIKKEGLVRGDVWVDTIRNTGGTLEGEVEPYVDSKVSVQRDNVKSEQRRSVIQLEES